MKEELFQKVRELPDAPGVYIFRGPQREVLYIGKASSLRNRVRSYFQAERFLSPKIQKLRALISDLEIVLTGSEAEALILEDALIKKYRPPFNTRLRDDKRYPYIKITNERFPRVVVVRRPEADGARYFGPYTSSKAMRRAIKLAHKLFPIRPCSLPVGEKLFPRPCLYYHIGRCSGPCAGLVSPREYARYVEGASLLFQGRVDEVIAQLKEEMKQAAQEERFEHAARVRDQIQALERIRERQVVALAEPADLDAIGIALEGNRGYGVVLLVRGGRLLGREGFALTLPENSKEEEALEEFLDQYYTRTTAIPEEILLPRPVAELEALLVYLGRKRGGKVAASVPKSGERQHLVELAKRNAELGLRRTTAEELAPEEEALELLSEALDLSVRPWRIEAFDISNLQGEEATGSMVVFVGGKPRRDQYRRFRVRLSGKPDDYAMMEEVLRRRFTHALAELADPTITSKKFSDLPDLVLVDGGKGQLSVAQKVLGEMGLSGIEVAALAKKEELIFRPNRSDPIKLPENSQALHLLQRLRDEAHRFAIDYHRTLRERRTLASLLDELPGIGEKRKQLLLLRFGSIDGLRQATLEELLSVPGLPRKTAELLYKALHP
ncbi:MAG: excinuclease ABC subunit UvrC [Candidatus Bipolaricaulota bacterium]|nr:excinuclease ABC subunit UvrC [Candidatus Bipolaricaulota bacterium]MDW8126849.1 excinuclease ABC subunit UvrC [Candidatus Bipolaricaulota bacterium]